MDLKKKWKRFWTLDRHHEAGFTLVELIVVIAIMAILGGVGSVAYGGYIKASNKSTDKTTVLNVMRALETANNSGTLSFVVDGQYGGGLQIPVGYVLIGKDPVSGDDYTVTVSQGRVEQNGNNYSSTGSVVNGEGNVIAAALKTAYGTNYAQEIKLLSDGWKADATASFYSSAGDMVDSVDEMGDNVLWLMDLLGANNGKVTLGDKTVNVFSQDYENSAELMQIFAEKLNEIDKITFLNSWENVSDENASFGLGGAGREHYSAARAAYNQCFASYVTEQNGGNPVTSGSKVTVKGTEYAHSSNCSTKIANYGKDAGQTIIDATGLTGWKAAGAWVTVNGALGIMDKEVTFPQTVCADTFSTTNNGSLKCPACEALYKQYTDDGIDKVNGEAFYDTMATGTAEGRDVLGNDMNEEKYFSWMKANANTFADMSNTVNGLVGDGSVVIIQVYYQDGLLNCAVSPKAILE